MLHNILNAFTGNGNGNGHHSTIKGTVVLMKKNVLDLNDLGASVLDRLHELVGNKVSLQLISSVNVDPGQYFTYLVFSLSFSVSHGILRILVRVSQKKLKS